MNTITNEQIKEAFERPELLKELFPDAFEPVLEAGKWYYGKKGQVAFYEIKAINSYTPNGYGIDANGNWCENTSWTFVNDPLYWRIATPEEVEKALINEAVKRGYCNSKIKGCNYYTENKYFYSEEYNMLFKGAESGANTAVFSSGKWAEIIETELELTLDQIAEKFGVDKVKIKP